MADDRTTHLEEEFDKNQEYLNWPGLQYSTNVIDNKPIMYMSKMFSDSYAESIDFSSFNTSNVVDMSFMFVRSRVKNIDLSNFDTSNVTNMYGMFSDSAATSGYARTQTDADKFNDSSVTQIPSKLKFTVK